MNEKKFEKQIIVIRFFWLQIHNQGYPPKADNAICDRFENGVKIETYTITNIFFISLEFFASKI